MKNIINYAIEENKPFINMEFGGVDSLILSKLAYLNFDGFASGLSDAATPMSIKEIADMDNTDALFHNTWDSKNNQRLFFALAGSSRFRDMKVIFYVNKTDPETEKQFSAVTFLLDDGSAYIAYRGTDSSFVGWKEDFNMAFISPVPSQEEGVSYLNAVADRISYPLKIGGHSKGGNIAVYSSIKCHPTAQERITQIFSHDGPGFRDEVFLSNEYGVIQDRIHKTLPQSSVIGMLLQHQENYSVVKSNRVWLMQHDPFSWLVDGNDFQYVQSMKKSALYMNGTLNQWVNSFDDEKRELFVNTLFQIIQATNATTFYDLTGDWPRKAAAVLDAIKDIDVETKAFVFQTIKALFVLAVKNIREIRSENLQ
ncbi:MULTISPECIES: DUF2974 domain-containing protein [unclassified Dehalobacter]|uniref:DUF2974 domain-containing protein n=1 Tax=unclassified Dehalobacter TaxID=2635733 RepID=UPI000E6BD5F8|nr:MULTISPECIES: DUF2974 domain-containing protein [unclassified Dehalobacter]RJE46686.1 hypothetical protein A7K50_12965 [Dehalobacter sp. MCB1]TCX47453.1 hypothetical protein C1I36_14135 [Dehalobacter sp. 14DCB1]TCX55666.1 hypothetical protein C1I38_03100 [Dehalobacter sp. 12DCB1]